MPAREPVVTLSRPKARRIGLIADTHIPDQISDLSEDVKILFKDVDLILHAGDITSPDVIRELESIAEVIAVRGNNPGDRRGFDPPLAERIIIEVADNCRIGLTHGMRTEFHHITDAVIGRSGFTSTCTNRIVRRVNAWFADALCIVFGHAHWPILEQREDRLFINPGKAFGKKRASCGVMEISKNEILIKIDPLGDSGQFHPLLGTWHTFHIQ